MNRIKNENGLEFGIYTLGDHLPNPHTGKRISAQQRIHEIIEFAKLADEAGLDFFSVGESHQAYFATQAHSVVLAAIAQATKNIKIGSSSTIISTSDPVRVFEDFATIDLISNGRAEIIAGRASRVGLYELLGYDLRNYEELFEEKFDLLNKINKEERVTWDGEFRASLRDAEVLPRPLEGKMPIWRAVGGTPASAIKAGIAGVPMFLAHLAGPTEAFKRSIDAYRGALTESGYNPAEFPIATAGLFYAAETTQEAQRAYYPCVNEGIKLTNGSGFSKRAFAQGEDVRDVLNVAVLSKLLKRFLYQYELFGHQRYIAQLDFGGVPFEELKKNLELIATDILPAIRKYTKGETA
ncbi:LOW QUALITY PROTEIN: luciferase-like monooxygenase [Bacillus sp. JCM 19047]|nr:LOW QUALITY PROTEIN: luciferase-like monooxygenase [Bacillus sp. JCM 19047]